MCFNLGFNLLIIMVFSIKSIGYHKISYFVAQITQIIIFLVYNRFSVFMINSLKTWSILLLIPMTLGVLIYFLVPLQFVIASTPKIQQAYNSNKINIQQTAVRSMIYTNSRVTSNSLQLYENIINNLVKRLNLGEQYDIISMGQNPLNNAHSLANAQEAQLSTFNLKRSMWYTGDPDTVPANDEIFSFYTQIQPLLQTIFKDPSGLKQGIERLQTTFVQNQKQYYFQYPSTQQSQFKEYGQNVLTNNYNMTIQNYQKYNRYTTILNSGQAVLINTVILSNNQPFGVMSMKINIQYLLQQLLNSFQASSTSSLQSYTNDIYLVRPLYQVQGLSNPQILGSFSTGNQSQVQIPTNSFFNLESHELSPQLFSSSVNYKLNIFRASGTQTYYNIPVLSQNYLNYETISMYLVMINNFDSADLQENAATDITVVMVVTSVVLFFISLVITSLALRHHLNRLVKMMNKFIDYCSLIIKGDLDIQIVYDDIQCQDISSLFKTLSILNKLHKYADLKYFTGVMSQKVRKYLQALTFFQEQNYPTSNLCQNIAQCYIHMKDYPKSVQYIRRARLQELQVYRERGYKQQIYSKSRNATAQKKAQLKKKLGESEKKYIRKMRKQVKYMTIALKPTDTDWFDQIRELIKKSKDLLRSGVYNFYVGVMLLELRFTLKAQQLNTQEQNIDDIGAFINKHGASHQYFCEYCGLPSDIVRAEWFEIKGDFETKEGNTMQAFDCYVQAFAGNKFNHQQFLRVMEKIKSILVAYNIDHKRLFELRWLKRLNQPRKDRQYIFMVDVSNPSMNIDQMKEWKRQHREFAQKIVQKFVYENDRITINQFCSNVKVCCNLVSPKFQEKAIRKELISAFKCRDRTVYSNVPKCLQQMIQRVNHLTSEKYFIIFLKDGHQINGKQISRVIKNTQNSMFVFVSLNRENISDMDGSFLLIDPYMKDIDRVLQEKNVKVADRTIYIF